MLQIVVIKEPMSFYMSGLFLYGNSLMIDWWRKGIFYLIFNLNNKALNTYKYCCSYAINLSWFWFSVCSLLRICALKEFSVNQCSHCQSYDIERVHRKFYQRLFIRRIIQCRQCEHMQKFFKYDLLNKADTAKNK